MREDAVLAGVQAIAIHPISGANDHFKGADRPMGDWTDRFKRGRTWRLMTLAAHPGDPPRKLGALEWSAISFLYWFLFMGALTPGNVSHEMAAGHEPDWLAEALRLCVAALLGASATPLLSTLATRFPLGAGQARRNLSVQLIACLAIAAGLIVVSCFLAAWLLDHRAAPTGDQVISQLFADLLLLVLCLSLLLGAIQVAPALFAARRSRDWPEQIAIGERGRAVVVPVTSIEWIETQGNYQALHTENGVHLYRSTSGALEAKLDPARFVRIHRRHIVSLAAIERIEPLSSGDGVVVMRSGARVRQARQYRPVLRARLRG